MEQTVSVSCALKRTPLYEQHLRAGGRMVEFHGWLLPVQYEGILAEHKQCRTRAAVFDTCHMGQFVIRGLDAAEELSRLLTRDPRRLGVGRAFYCHMLNEDGGTIDDTILMRTGPSDFLLVVNAGPRKRDFAWLRNHLYGKVDLVDQSLGWGKIDVQGPWSYRVLEPLFGPGLGKLGYFGVTRTRVCDEDCILSRTGYTGELGYEICLPNTHIGAMWEMILARPEVKPAGLGARDLLRLEMGYPLHGQDISPNADPLEADLMQFMSLEHDYVGAATLRDRVAVGPSRRLVAFVGESRRKPHTGDEILADGDVVGEVTSGAFSPSLGAGIGMGYVATAHAAPGTRLTVRTSRADVPVEVREKPLYTGGTCRTKNLMPEE